MKNDWEEISRIPDCDAYFEEIQSRKKLSSSLQKTLASAFSHIPVSSFPDVPGGKVIEIPSDTLVANAVRILSEHKIMSAPVTSPQADDSRVWRMRYLGIIDYSAIILWVMENAELAAVALSTGSATAAGLGVGAVGALGALAMGTTGPFAIAGITAAAVSAAAVGGVAAGNIAVTGAPTAADRLGNDFYKIILQEEPFKSTTVHSIIKSFRWAPFLPVSSDSSMLTVLLLLSKYRMRNVPVIEPGRPLIKNFITQSAVIKGLQQCRGRDWFDCISSRPLSDFGLPFMSYDEVIFVRGDELILEAFKRMKDNKIGRLPVLEGSNRKIIGSVSIRDIRFLLLEPELFSNFRHLTVIDFLQTTSLSPEPANSSALSPPMCKPDALLGSVIDEIASRGVHRIYVVEEDSEEVVGVVTLRDVISCFIYEPPNHFDNYFGFSMKEIVSQ
ncbi:5'-AMP-activated protein kinase subunit gamma-3 [Zostera marina]|uniref:5'-AMP-activated protein kinase subunit gamma-3 n=1 Tax=Zostera marina TaxID=29655 RepID=A0A0K9PPL8_ZOSMR|nr:5'-AMP-activated protein kinase subunit gamma-3 [Zostera marina]